MPGGSVDKPVEVEPIVPDASQDPVDVTPPVEPKLSSEEQLAAKIREDFEKLYNSRFQQVEHRLHGAQRINERLQKEVDELKKVATPASTPSGQNSDPWATIENGTVWRQEVERVATQKAEELLRQREAERASQQVVQHHHEALGDSKRQVVAKYPDLDPETGTTDSPVAKAYLGVLQEHPDWLTNPYGPILAMYTMEEKLERETTGPSTPGKTHPSPGGLPPSRPTPTTSPRLVLTREQKAFCDYHRIPYEDYLKMASVTESPNGVEA